MGRGGQGRPAKPTKLSVLHGDRKDRINDAEPVPSGGDIHPPDGLSDAAVRVWERLAPDLQRTGVLTPWDADEFAVVCDAVARHRHAARVLDEEREATAKLLEDEEGTEGGMVVGGETGINRFGERVVSPWFRVWTDTASVLAKFGGRFGLSPSDRAQLKVGDAKSQGPKEDLLSG